MNNKYLSQYLTFFKTILGILPISIFAEKKDTINILWLYTFLPLLFSILVPIFLGKFLITIKLIKKRQKSYIN